jgi:hypothetical protein
LDAVSGTAKEGVDFVSTPFQALTFEAGVTSKTFTVSTNTDSVVERSETMSLKLFSAINGAGLLVTGTGTINNVNPLPTYSISNATASEGGVLTFTITRGTWTAGASEVYLKAVSGTATEGVDFASTQLQQLVFATGETSKTFTVSTYTDSVVEGSETMSLKLFSTSNGTGLLATGTGTINNVNPLVPTYSISNATASEGGVLTFTIARATWTAGASRVYLDALSGTATEGVDFASTPMQVLAFAIGETSKTFTVSTYTDSLVEGSDTMSLQLFSASNGTGLLATGTGTINNVNASPTYSISKATANEGGALTFTLTRGTYTAGASMVYLDAVSGTATEGVDFASKPLQALAFAAGETSKTFTVSTYMDSVVEGSETMSLKAFSASNGTGLLATGTGTIKNVNSMLPTYSISNETASEFGVLTFTIIRSTYTAWAASTVYLDAVSGTATEGVDFASTPMQQLVFATGETSKTFTVSTYMDSVVEGSETMSLKLFSASDGTGLLATGTGTINNVNTVSTYSISNPTVSEGGVLSFTITRDPATAGATVYLDAVSRTATEGVDFSSTSMQALAFATGETSKTFSVSTYTDSVVEGSETISLKLFSASNGTGLLAAGTGTINNALPPTYSISNATAIEGGVLTFTITRDPYAAASTVFLDAVSGTATEAVDFASTLMQQLAFATGETSKTFTVRTYMDSKAETSETMLLKLTSAFDGSGSLATGTGTINNLNALLPTYGISNATASEGGVLTFTVTRGTYTAGASTVYLDAVSGTAKEGDDFVSTPFQELTFAAGETSKAFTVSTYTDSVVEGSETMLLKLFFPGTGLLATSTGTITELKDLGYVLDYSQAEPDSLEMNLAALADGNASKLAFSDVRPNAPIAYAPGVSDYFASTFGAHTIYELG